MWNRPLEFKIFFAAAIVFLIAVLVTQRPGVSGRPKNLFWLYLIYIVFECVNLTEFYPFTNFPYYARPEEKKARYLQVRCLLEGGTVLSLSPELILPVLANGRLKHFTRSVFQRPELSDAFADSFAEAYENKIRKSVGPKIREIHFEKKKWDFVHEPLDPEHGYLVQRYVGRPRKNP